MKAFIDIENARTQKVITLIVPVIEKKQNDDISFDISKITDEERKILIPAISTDKDLTYTDIEMFFLEDSNIPNFGPDYDFTIKDNILYGIYNRCEWLEQRKKEMKKNE